MWHANCQNNFFIILDGIFNWVIKVHCCAFLPCCFSICLFLYFLLVSSSWHLNWCLHYIIFDKHILQHLSLFPLKNCLYIPLFCFWIHCTPLPPWLPVLVVHMPVVLLFLVLMIIESPILKKTSTLTTMILTLDYFDKTKTMFYSHLQPLWYWHCSRGHSCFHSC